MILIGQYDSPFVRRVAVALQIYGMGYEHRPWSTFGDAEIVGAYNPLRRVPVLVLDDGDVLIESGAILDWLDETAGVERRLIEKSGLARRHALKICALAAGLCEKMVGLVYERVLHQAVSEPWVARCAGQIVAGLDALEDDLARRDGVFWFSGRPGHADIAAACAMRFLSEAHPGLDRQEAWPRLRGLARACEGMVPFRSVVQAFIPPA